MPDSIISIIQIIGQAVEIAGVAAIIIGFLVASGIALRRLLDKTNHHHGLFRFYRQSLARSVLIGLEFLVAGDIIRTVTNRLTLEDVAILGGIVLIRIALGISLESEVNDTIQSRTLRRSHSRDTNSQ